MCCCLFDKPLFYSVCLHSVDENPNLGWLKSAQIHIVLDKSSCFLWIKHRPTNCQILLRKCIPNSPKKRDHILSVKAPFLRPFQPFKTGQQVSMSQCFTSTKKGWWKNHLSNRFLWLRIGDVQMSQIPNWLVVWTPLKNMKVNWDDYSQYMGK